MKTTIPRTLRKVIGAYSYTIIRQVYINLVFAKAKTKDDTVSLGMSVYIIKENIK